MYSTFLPFVAIVVDLASVFVYFKYEYYLLGGATAMIAIFPLVVTAVLLYTRWTRWKQATIFIGFLHSGSQLLFQTTVLTRYWYEFNRVLITYGTISSPHYSVVLVDILFCSLVVAKSARECHFLSQDPNRKHHARASHFRATPFFLLHTSYRSVSVAIVVAFLPVWVWVLILVVLLATNFFISKKILGFSNLFSTLTSFSAILTPSIFPTDSPIHISTIARFHVINSVVVTVIISFTALTTNSYTRHNVVSLSSDCPPVLSPSPSPNILFSQGVLPPILVTGLIYILSVVFIMTLVRPNFLSLPHLDASKQTLTESLKISEKENNNKTESLQLNKKQNKIRITRPLSLDVNLMTKINFNLGKSKGVSQSWDLQKLEIAKETVL